MVRNCQHWGLICSLSRLASGRESTFGTTAIEHVRHVSRFVQFWHHPHFIFEMSASSVVLPQQATTAACSPPVRGRLGHTYCKPSRLKEHIALLQTAQTHSCLRLDSKLPLGEVRLLLLLFQRHSACILLAQLPSDRSGLFWSQVEG